MSIVAGSSRPREEGLASIRARSCYDFPSRTPAEKLTDDLLVEILSRVPAKEVCRCKCVCKHWLGLIHHRDHRKRLPQTLAGFFFGSSTTGQRLLEPPFHFTSLSGDRRPPFDTSFTFLPNHRPPRVHLLDSCNGLLLCRRYDVSDGVVAFHYVVCNPATEKWVVLPNSVKATGEAATTCLGFDPALSPNFHVFELVHEHKYGRKADLSGVVVYSSETGEWVFKEKRWNGATWPTSRHSSGSVFLNSLLFFRAFDLELHECVAAVDTKGETWMKFRIPGSQVDDFGLADSFIQRSQGRLHYVGFQRDKEGVAIRFVVYVLENYQGEPWILKHSIETSNIFGWRDLYLDGRFDFIAIHPECDLVFIIAGGMTFMCYNMDNRQVNVISYLAGAKQLFLPYVPLFTESQSLHI
ncbi:hypothetical protein CFC21_105897 [Triticum aestivum]|uniref:F-box domain-containing protein n=2 Tax=Triticum aestivum TaxID=4565 RepID=A0A9R1N921_WHEAT|nr:F-box protein At5g07610-like [Triticum aestivum]KAF7105055.1 hypothetical protein CFC21_105897 [Triticum aestivum]